MKKPTLARALGFLTPAALLPVPALADGNSTFDAGYQEVLITATRTEVALNNLLASATVVSRTRLEALQPADLGDVLSQVPGLDISRSGGLGAQSSLYTRGTANGHTLFLVDGQRIGSATLGSTNFQFLNPDQIERVEVVRGSRSSLYGSDAIGGVVQVFTRDGSGTPGSYLSAGTGSHDLYQVALGTSGRADSLRYGLHLSHLNTEGFDNLEVDTGNNADDDGYRNTSVSGSLGYTFANDADVALRFLQSDNRNEYDSAFSPDDIPYSNAWLQNINLSGSLPVNDIWTTRLSAGVATDDTDNLDGVSGANTGHFRTRREQLFWQNDVIISEGHLLTLGYDIYEDDVTGSTAYSETSRENKAAFAQYQGGGSGLDWVIGFRNDDNEAYGEHNTGNVALGVNLSADHRVILSWAEGFKAPTFNDLYWPEGPYTAGNPNLKAEESENIELGLHGRCQCSDSGEGIAWQLAYFENDVENLIDWAPGPDFVWRPYNVSNAEIQGAELSLVAELVGWHWDLGYTYVEPRDAATGKLLIKRSRNNLSLNADRDFGDLSLGFSFKTQDSRFTNAGNTQSIGGYATAAVRVAYQLSTNLEANLKLENLFDRDYRLNRGYNQDGFNWRAGITYSL